jgi:hypothetical protein
MHHLILQGDRLADETLMIGIALILFPLIIALSIWSAIGIEFRADTYQKTVSSH